MRTRVQKTEIVDLANRYVGDELGSFVYRDQWEVTLTFDTKEEAQAFLMNMEHTYERWMFGS